MAAIPFALSVHHFVSTVGADAGFAAIIGLAILVLLFFSQARETSTLRKRAAESEEHVQQLEQRVAQLSRATATGAAGAAGAPAAAQAATGAQPRPGVMPAPASVRSMPAASPAASRTVSTPQAPAGVGAPALSAATRMIPSGDEGAISVRTADDHAAPVVAAAATAAAAGAAAAAASGSGNGPEPESGGGVMAPPGPAPATAAGANGTAGRSAPPPMPAPAPPPAAARSGQQPPRGPMRPPSTRPSGSGPRRPAPPSRGRSGWATAGLVAAGLLVVAAVVVVLLVVTSGSSSSSSSSSSALSNAPATSKHHRAAVTPADVNVIVLNGTPTPNLAHDITQRLSGAGYKTGAPATATDQNQSATVVGYLRGHKDGALLVAKSLKLGSASVQPVSQSSDAVACPQASTCKAQVVVTVGADLASSASTTSTSTT